MTNTNTNTARTYRRTENHRACENFGSVRLIITETLTAVEGGIRVDTHATGIQEGRKVDQRSSCFAAVTLDRAGAYRLSIGYHAVAA